MEKLKQRWGIDSNLDLILILAAFSVNGSFAAWIGGPLMKKLNLSEDLTHAMVYWPVRIVSIFVIYQFTLVLVGTAFGQHKFFWAMEKKMLKRIGFKRFFKED